MNSKEGIGSDRFWGLDPNTPAGAMLRMLPETFRLFERISTAMAVIAAQRAQRPLRLLLMAAPPADNLIPAVTIGLLVQDLVHRHQTGRPLLNGDIIVLTPVPRRSMTLLQNVKLNGISITEVWEVETLSRYTEESSSDKPRVYFANPGWIQRRTIHHLSSVVIDSFLPYVLRQLPDLLNTFQNVPLCILITPPLPENKRPIINNHEELTTWLWDPAAKQEPMDAQRRIWICEAGELGEALEEAEMCLWSCLDVAQSSFLSLKEAWGIYHQLRQLVVPLSDLEETVRPSLRNRLERLRAQEPPQADMEVRWYSLLSALDRAYQYLIALQEPPKFWALAFRLDELLRSTESNFLRVAVPTWAHQRILMLCLLSLFGERVLERIEVITPMQEARRVAAGDIRQTLLPGYRPASYRFLDLYFPEVIEVFAYPYEAALEQEFWSRFYADLEKWQQLESRRAALTRLGFEHFPKMPSPTPRPALVMEREVLQTRRARIVYPTPGFVIERLLESWDQEFEWSADREVDTSGRSVIPSGVDEVIQVALEDGRCLTYFPSQFVYVFYEAQDQVRRMQAAELRPGMRLVLLVDAVYEGLYERLLDALRARMGHVDRLYLDLWQAAKDQLRKNCVSLRDLHAQLAREGLSIQYPAFVTYFRGPDLDEATLAPLYEKDMAIMARRSGLFPNEQMIHETFRRIRVERKLRRQAGRALHQILRSIVSGTGYGYKEALQFAREIGEEVYDVFAAVEVVTICEVHK
ncbi:hypothetical protein DRN74_04755 [Candidatus Micrarchaeota archaeon]|nr:MAG: hypothetical protein DRN74_04755 [Candidatus Micrarchaeota archaeon]